MTPSSSRLRSAGPRRLRARRRALLLGCALGSSLALVARSDGAHAQAINATPTTVNGVVTYSRIVSPTPNTETITIETPSAIIDWTPPIGGPPTNPYIFLPAGNTVTYQNGINTADFAVLNRILTNIPSEFDGTVISRLNTLGGGSVPGGTILFSSPGGIILGPTAVFDVGNLVLTTLNVEVNGAGQFISPNGTFQYEFNNGGAFPNAAIVLQPGSQIFANSENSYIALVAPRIDQGGSVRTNGSVAYIAGEDLGFSVNQGLFDIEVNVGTDNAIPIEHSGSTGGPASSAAGDNHRIYMVAVPKNQAITMLLSGSVGFDAAVSASVENGEIVLAGGQNLEEISDPVVRFSDQAPGSQFNSNITIENGAFTSDVEARTLGTLRLQAATADLSFSGDVSLLGTSSVDLFASDENSLTIGGNLEGASYSNRNALAGTIRVRAESGASIDVTGSTELRADPLNLFDTSDPPGFPEIPQAGDVDVEASGGFISFGGNATFAAQGFSQSSTNSRGGTVSVLSEAGGQIDFAQGATLDASAQAGSTGLVAGNTNGGTAEIVADGGSIDVGADLLVIASVVGGGAGAASGGDGTGGTARLTSINGGDIGVTGSASLSAGGIGGVFTGGAGTGGDVDLVVDGGALDVGSALAISVLGLGGDAAPGSSAPGGTGTGGSVSVRFASTSSTVDFLDIDAAGVGGAGAGGPGVGGDGGLGQGGDVSLVVEAGDLQVGVLNISARGQGGAGGNGAELSPGAVAAGGAGGDGRGGDAVADVQGGNLTLLTAVVSASGQGGVGGTGSASSLVGGDGGAGGAGVGGLAEIGTSGGQLQALDPDGLAILAVGTGGDGGAGGGVDSAAGPGGDGGTGGEGTGGDARLVSSAGSITAGPAFLRADAVGGSGGAGGASGASGGVGGTGGNAASGEARLDAFGGTITLGDVQVAVNAFGGSGGSGGKGPTNGSGGDGGDAIAGIDQTSFTRGAYVVTEGGNLTVASGAVQANGIGGVGGSGTTGGNGGNGSGGSAQFASLGGTLQSIGLVDLGADGVGAPGGFAVATGPVGGAGGNGGNGVGGLSLISAENDPSAVVIAPDVSLLARGLGGDGGAGALGTATGGDGGIGGDGTGGTAQVLGQAGSITTADADLGASGVGGFGGNGGDSDSTAGVGGDGGAAGAGSGGTALVGGSSSTIGSSLTLADVSLDASGVALAGGTGGAAATNGAAGAVPATTGGQVRINSDVNPATGALASVTAGDVTMTAVGDSGSRIEIFARGAPLTMDSLTALGRGVAFNETFASDATLRVDGDASIDVDADLYLYTVGTGLIDVGGTLQLLSPASIITDERPGGAPATSTIRTGSLLATAGGSFEGNTTTITAANLIDIDANGSITLGSATAGGDIALDAPDNIIVGFAQAGDDFTANTINFFSGGTILSTGLGTDSESGAGGLAGSNILIGGGFLVSLDNADAADDLGVSAAGDIFSSGLLTAGGNISLGATGFLGINEAQSGGSFGGGGLTGLSANSITAGGSISLGTDFPDASISVGTAISGGSIDILAFANIFAGTLQAADDIVVTTSGDNFDRFSIDIGSATAGGNIELNSSRDISIALAQAGGDFRARPFNDFTGTTVIAGNDIDVQGGVVRIDNGSAGRDILLIAGAISSDVLLEAGRDIDAGAGPIDIATATAGRNLILGGDIDALSLIAGDSIALFGSATVASAQAGNRIDASVNIANFGNFTAGNSIAIDATSLNLNSATAGVDVTLNASGDIALGFAQAGDDFTATAGGSFNGGTVRTTGLGADSESGTGALAGSNIVVDAGAAANLFAATAAGTVTIDSRGNLILGRATAGGDIDLASSDGSILSGTGGSDSVGSLDAGGDILADAGVDILIGDAQAGGAIDLDAGRDIALRNADAGGSFLARAGGNAGFSGAVTAPSIAVVSADIDVDGSGSLGDAKSQTVTLTVQPTTQQTVLGGAAEGPGYTLTEAEANRIAADTLRIVAPVTGTSASRAPDVLVHDLALSGQRLGVLELIAQGVMQVDGNLLLAGVRADGGIDIRANQRLEILNPTGSIRVRDGAGLTDGNLSLTSSDIWSADQSILNQLRADPNFAGRDEALAAAPGTEQPRGSIEAGDVTISVANSLFVQNTGTATVFAGITVRENTLRIVPTGNAPLSVFAFGRRINPDGTFVTNNDFFSEVVFETRGAAPGYTDEAQFNLCFINSRACSRGDPDNPLPGGKDIIEEPVDPSVDIGLAPGADDIVDTSFADEPLIEEPVTSGSDSILWDCDRDDDGDCDEDDTNG